MEYSCYLFIDTIFKNTSSTIHHEHTIPIVKVPAKNITALLMELGTKNAIRADGVFICAAGGGADPAYFCPLSRKRAKLRAA